MRGLSKLYHLKKEIEEIRWELEELPELPTESPHSNQDSEELLSVMQKKDKQTERLISKIDKYMDEVIRIEDAIEQIDDAEVRRIARMRSIKCMKWDEIGEVVHLDRSVCSRKVNKYIKKSD